MELDQKTIEAIADSVINTVSEIRRYTYARASVEAARIVLTADAIGVDMRQLGSKDVCRALLAMQMSYNTIRPERWNATSYLRRAIESIGRKRYGWI